MRRPSTLKGAWTRRSPATNPFEVRGEAAIVFGYGRLARAGFAAGRGAGFDRDADRRRGLGLSFERRGETTSNLHGCRATAGDRCLHAFERCLHGTDDALELALHAHADLEQGRQVRFESTSELRSGLCVGGALQLDHHASRRALELRVELGVAIGLALGGHLRRLDFTGALGGFELDAATTRARTRAVGFALHLAVGGAGTLAVGRAGALTAALAGAFAATGAIALAVFAVASAFAGAVALAAEAAAAFTLAAAGAT